MPRRGENQWLRRAHRSCKGHKRFPRGGTAVPLPENAAAMARGLFLPAVSQASPTQTSVTRYRERTAASAPRAVLRRVRWSSAFAPLRAASRPFAPGTRARGARGSSVRNPEAKARPSYAGGRAPPPQRVGGRRPLCEPRVHPSLARGKGAGPPFAVRTREATTPRP